MAAKRAEERWILAKEIQVPQYAIVYLGGNQPSSPEEGKQYYARYTVWLSSLGNAAVSPANPFKSTSTVHPDGTVVAGSETAMSGYTIIEAASMEAALEMAKTCPFLEIGGSLEVSELVQMPVHTADVKAPRERRKGLFEQDALGRTPLFDAAEKGLEERVKEMIYSLRGTGLSPARLALIAAEDHTGLTAADVAEQNGHEEIARLLRSEQGRMEYYG
jgi:hypothetical protein